MKLRTLLCAALVAAVVIGCAPGIKPLDGGSALGCPGASCDVVVYVSGDLAAGTPVVGVNIEELHVPRGNSPQIVWKLQAPGYEFHRDSIAPHTTGPVGSKGTTTQAEWDDQISYVSNTTDRFTVKDMNRASGALFYNVTVYHSSTQRSFKLDPAIVNDF